MEGQDETGRAAVRKPFLDRMLAVDSTRDPRIYCASLLVMVPVVSSILSVLLYVAYRVLIGEPISQEIAQTVGVIAALTSSGVGAPTILFTHIMLQRLRRQRREMNEALESARLANTARSAFLANISHEIRTPMNGVLGMTQVLQAGELTTNQREIVEIIGESGSALVAMLDDILDLAKIDAGRMAIAPRDEYPAQLLSNVVRMFAPRADEKGVKLELEVDPSTPQRARIDGLRVRQCVGNLISNAVKFTTEGAVAVSLSAIPEGDGWIISVAVTDTGIGMTSEEASRVFKPFEQASEMTTGEYGGSGLGLAISRRLARMMQGDVVVSSIQGEGSTFTLTFRAERPEALVEPEQADEADDAEIFMALNGSRVLVVDDTLVNRKVLFMLLQPMGAQVFEAANGEEALAMLAKDEYDVVLLDVHMPVLDGKKTIQRIRASTDRWSTIPVVALTADAMVGEREKLLGLGMDGYATKPIDVATLIGEVERVLRASMHKQTSHPSTTILQPANQPET